MLKTEVAQPLNLRLLERRRNSQTDHINRIRGATLKSQYIPWWKTAEERNFHVKSKSYENEGKSISLSQLSHRRSHTTCVPKESYEHFYNESSKQNNSPNVSLSWEMKLSLDSVKENALRKSSVSHQKSKSGTSKLKESSRRKSLEKENLQKPVKKISTKGAVKNVKKANTSQKSSKAVKLKEKRGSRNFKKDKKNTEQKNVNALSQRKLSQKRSGDNNYNLKQYPYDKTNEIANFIGPISQKDIIVLKWLHELTCPIVDKLNVKEDVSHSEDSKRCPIRILKRPLKSTADQYVNVPMYKKKPKGMKSKTVINSSRNKIEPIKKKKSISFSGVITGANDEESFKKTHRQHKLKKSLSSQPLSLHKQTKAVSEENSFHNKTILNKIENKESELKGGTISLNEKSSEPHDVEMYVSELKKLYITMNLKSLSPEDAAIVIWLDDLPKLSMEPNFQKRLSITSFKDMQPARNSVLKSHSVPLLEDIASPRPNIYFPSVTILKNLAVDSKVGLRELNEDALNSVFYKRCNLNHVGWEKS